MNKNKLTKEASSDKKINELAKTTTRKLKQVKSKSGTINGNSQKLKSPETKKQKWILVNKQGKLSGILE